MTAEEGIIKSFLNLRLVHTTAMVPVYVAVLSSDSNTTSSVVLGYPNFKNRAQLMIKLI